MEYRRLSKDGTEIPVLGLGAWPIGGGMGHVDEQNALSTIHAAIDNGITLIDTAQAYLTSETTLGKALKNGYRERCFLATKVSQKYSHQDILTAMDNSLKALDVDYVDLYQIHNWRPEYPIEESMETMAELQKAGKTRYIGVSNFSADQMQQAAKTAPFQFNQPRYNMIDREIEAEDIPYCARQGIAILAHSPLAKGLLTGKYSRDYTFPADDERSRFERFQGKNFQGYMDVADQLKEIAQSKGITTVQLAIAWNLRLPAVTCVLLGAKTPQHVEGYLGAVGVQFTDEELTRIDTILAGAPQVFIP